MVRLERLFGWLAVLFLAHATWAEAGRRIPDWWADPANWWQTPDQRGAELYAQGAYAAARREFRLPGWKAAACYRAKDYECAALHFADMAGEPAILEFNRGNADAMRGRFDGALAHFDAALALRPAWQVAEANRRLVLQLVADRTRRPPPGHPTGEDPNLEADHTVFDGKGKDGKPGQIRIEKTNPASLGRQWLRQIPTDAGEFLRLRFAHEAETQSAPPPGAHP